MADAGTSEVSHSRLTNKVSGQYRKMLRKYLGYFHDIEEGWGVGEQARYFGKISGISGNIFRRFCVIFVARSGSHN